MKIFSGKNLFLPAKTIFASPVFTAEKNVFSIVCRKNLRTLGLFTGPAPHLALLLDCQGSLTAKVGGDWQPTKDDF